MFCFFFSFQNFFKKQIPIFFTILFPIVFVFLTTFFGFEGVLRFLEREVVVVEVFVVVEVEDDLDFKRAERRVFVDIHNC